MVKPVLSMPQQFKDKGVPEQILKYANAKVICFPPMLDGG